VRDEFNNASFGNNNGTENWASNWIESHDDGNPSYGDIEIRYGELMLKDDDRAIERAANLADAATAVLSFDYRRYSFDSSSDYVDLQISTDGGVNWTEIDRLTGPANERAMQAASYDLAEFIPNDIIVRFLTSSSLSNHDRFYIDNVQIEFGIDTATDDTTSSPPESTGDPQIVRDEFNAVDFGNNDGNENWNEAWLGVDFLAGGATSGHIKVENGRLTFHNLLANTEYTYRSANLTGATAARLTFDWQTDGLNFNEALTVLVSQDGYQFTELAAYGGSQSGSASFDISDYIGDNTTISFTAYYNNWGLFDYAYIDNIQIEAINPTANHYLNTLNVQPVWNQGVQGQGVTVAVIDSGISPSPDFGDRLVAQVSFNTDAESANDSYGHGTHVAGIIGGNGANSNGFYQGIAPQVNLIGLKVSDETGMAYETDTVAAMQWVLENKDTYNIRVVNLSINSISEESYHTSALDLASEILWFNDVVVVASAGNRSRDGNFYTITASPANDPFIITVGASNEKSTDSIEDDYITLFSAHGTTVDDFVKPNIIAPGYGIVSVLSDDTDWNTEYPGRLEYFGDYFRLSGTSMAAPIVSGAAALLLQAEPYLTPDQVKYRLLNTGSTIKPLWFDAILDRTEYPYLDVTAIISSPTIESANQDTMPHMALAQMALIAYWASENGGNDIDWSNIDWDSVNWDNVDWDNVDWSSVNWGSVNWGSVNWGSVNWGSVNWGSVNWGSVNWGSVNWGSVNWGSVNWGSVSWVSDSWED
jgi:serine protease AprX